MSEKGKATPKGNKSNGQNKREWNKIHPGNIEYVEEGKFLVLKVDLTKVFKPSSSFYKEGAKKKTNILVASTSGNKKLLNGDHKDLAISVNMYRPMTEKEIEEYSK